MNEIVDDSIGVLDAVFHRRAVRSYAPKEVTEATVHQLLRAAAQAPSAMNRQPWSFAVMHGRKRLQDYSERAKRYLVATYPTTFEVHSRSELYGNPSYDLFHGANTLIVIYAQSAGPQPSEDCCLAAENLMLAAYGLGLGTCPIGFARSWFNLPETKAMINVPEHYCAVFPVVLGHPAGRTEVPSHDEPSVVAWHWDKS